MPGAIQRHLKQQRPFGTLEEEVFVGIHLAANRLIEPWERYLRREADLTEVQYNVLRILRGAGEEGLLVGELAERLITRSPDVTRLIDRLQRRGLVHRERDAADRRAMRLRITPQGRERIAPLDAASRAALRGLLDGVDPARLEALRDALGAVLDAVERGG